MTSGLTRVHPAERSNPHPILQTSPSPRRRPFQPPTTTQTTTVFPRLTSTNTDTPESLRSRPNALDSPP